jgi:hypothetical protein
MGVSQAIQRATRRHLREINQLDDPLAHTALVLAKRLDANDDPASGMAGMAKELRTIVETLARTATTAADPVDELRQRREARRRGA